MDRRAWSGTHYSMARSLQTFCGDVQHLGSVFTRLGPSKNRTRRLAMMVLGKYYDYTTSIPRSRILAWWFRRALKKMKPDLIFAPAGSVEIALLDTDIPIVYLSDATFTLMQDYYPAVQKTFKVSKWEAQFLERAAIRKAASIIYPSEWAAKSAIEDYGADPGKVHVVPFGANFESVPLRDRIFDKCGQPTCKLLFLGRDWMRKGGDIALEALNHLRASGVDARLTVCGCVPPTGTITEHVDVIPFLDKNDEGQRIRLESLLLSHHFLILPTRAECFGIVFCEAAAHGLPSVATDTGGVPSAVRNGRNGYLFPLSARGDKYAELIRSVYLDAGRYRDLVGNCRNTYDQLLSWDLWGQSTNRIMASLITH